MPNAVDAFHSFYSQYTPAPSAGGANALAAAPVPAPAGNTPASNPYASSYVPDPSRAAQPAAGQPGMTTQALGTALPLGTLSANPAQPPVNPQPWNNPNYPGTPPLVPNQQPAPYPAPGQVYPAQTGGVQPNGYPNPYGGYGAPAGPGPITATMVSLQGVIHDKGYDKFVNQTAPVIDQAIPVIGAIVGLIQGNKQQPTGTQSAPSVQTVYQPTANPGAYPNPYPTQGYPAQPYPNQGYPAQYPNQQVWGVQVQQVQQGIQGVATLVNTIGGWFK